MENLNAMKPFEFKDNILILYNENHNRIFIEFINDRVLRIRVSKNEIPKPSIMIKLGFIKQTHGQTKTEFLDKCDHNEMVTSNMIASFHLIDNLVTLMDKKKKSFLNIKSIVDNLENDGNRIVFDMGKDEHFYGFGFQRKTFDARGHLLTFTKRYRWDEATVPFFMSTAGYGIFSANTYDHAFDFTADDRYSIKTTGGEIDLFIFYGPSFKKIIEQYTSLTGKPQMVPKWSLGLCYIARLFEDEKGIKSIASKFREEGIPCDMIGLEPGWEEHYYSMKWIWNKNLFPDPKEMIESLKKQGYAFELWESGDAPTKGYLDPEKRKRWFEKRVATSLDYGVDFFKQDDPYPRCITSQEMVTDPKVEVFLQDDNGVYEEETRNIANTLYSATVFDEFRRLTNKRTIVIFHSYNASVSSQRYPTAWAGDFQLGNGALNASLSGHAMVSQDMNNESPKGIHFGFLTPYSVIDSWAYYREPWLFSKANLEMTRLYSRLRSNLFPYLYSTLWQSHSKGIPMLRPMILEFQEDTNTYFLDKQFMLGDFLLVGTGDDKEAKVYLPKGTWIDYWTRKIIKSKGQWEDCSWPDTVGGPLFIKAGALLAMTAASDSILLSKQELFVLDVYPSKKSEYKVYEDDGISFEYEANRKAITKVSCKEDSHFVSIQICNPKGDYEGMPINKAYLVKVYLENNPLKIFNEDKMLSPECDLKSLLFKMNSGYFFEAETHTLYIKPINDWKLREKKTDMKSFYGGEVVMSPETIPFDLINLRIEKANKKVNYGKIPSQITIESQYKVLLADGESKNEIRANIIDEQGLPVKSSRDMVKFTMSGDASFENGKQDIEVLIINGQAKATMISSFNPQEISIKASCYHLKADEITIPLVQGEFNVMINPPQRIKLRYADNWLSYYIFVNLQIEYQGIRVDSAFSDIRLLITGNDERNIIRNHQIVSSSGIGRFDKIILGEPTQPPDVKLYFNAKGVKPLLIGYCVKPNIYEKN